MLVDPDLPIPSQRLRMFLTPANASSSSSAPPTPGPEPAGLAAAITGAGGLGRGREATGVPGADGGTGLNGARSRPAANVGVVAPPPVFGEDAGANVVGGGGGGGDVCLAAKWVSKPSESGKRCWKSFTDAFGEAQCVTEFPRGRLGDVGVVLASLDFRRRPAGLREGGGRFGPAVLEMVSYRETREEIAACRLTDCAFGATRVSDDGAMAAEGRGVAGGDQSSVGRGVLSFPCGAKRRMDASAGPRSISPSSDELESTRSMGGRDTADVGGGGPDRVDGGPD